jgi:hypothetical protein
MSKTKRRESKLQKQKQKRIQTRRRRDVKRGGVQPPTMNTDLNRLPPLEQQPRLIRESATVTTVPGQTGQQVNNTITQHNDNNNDNRSNNNNDNNNTTRTQGGRRRKQRK